MMTITDSNVPGGKPMIRTITAEDVYAALAAGWADFRAAPAFGLFFGGVYAAARDRDPPDALGGRAAVLDRALRLRLPADRPVRGDRPLRGQPSARGGPAARLGRHPRGGMGPARQPDPVDGLRGAGGLHGLDVGCGHPGDPVPRPDAAAIPTSARSSAAPTASRLSSPGRSSAASSPSCCSR